MKKSRNCCNIADWMKFWEHFDVDLYIRLLAIRNQID
jgi:hypothetical protein